MRLVAFLAAELASDKFASRLTPGKSLFVTIVLHQDRVRPRRHFNAAEPLSRPHVFLQLFQSLFMCASYAYSLVLGILTDIVHHISDVHYVGFDSNPLLLS